jgi:hypothetical protein
MKTLMVGDGPQGRGPRGIQFAHREPVCPRFAWLCAGRQSPCTCLAESERAQGPWVILPLFHRLSGAGREAVTRAFREVPAGSRTRP